MRFQKCPAAPDVPVLDALIGVVNVQAVQLGVEVRYRPIYFSPLVVVGLGKPDRLAFVGEVRHKRPIQFRRGFSFHCSRGK